MAVCVHKYPISSARKVKPDRYIESWRGPSFKKLQEISRVEQLVFLSNWAELSDGNRSIDVKNW
jgi:hypothetical protein